MPGDQKKEHGHGMMDESSGTVVSVNTASQASQRKRPVTKGLLVEEHGLQGDGHSGSKRQVSLLAKESIETMRLKGLDVGPGDFAENITTRGMTLHELPGGTHLAVSGEAEREVTAIGKTCHERCAIFMQAGDCVRPKHGVFVRVVTAGVVKPGDTVGTSSRTARPERNTLHTPPSCGIIQCGSHVRCTMQASSPPCPWEGGS